MIIVEEETHESLGNDSGRPSGGFGRNGGRNARLRRGRLRIGHLDAEVRDLLRLPVVKQPEIFLMEIAYRPAFVVAHHHSHQHQVAFGANAELRRGLVRLHFRRVSSLLGGAET